MTSEERVTTKTTRKTYTDGVGSDMDSSFASTYRPSMAPRSVIIQRNTYSSGSPSGGYGSSSNSMRSQRSGMLGSSIAMSSYAPLANTGVLDVKTSRQREKKDMQDLNERFASYIEKVRFLEAQNKKLTDELEKLKSKWGKETTQIKAMYHAELDEARKLLDDAEKEKARLEIRVASLEEINQELESKLHEIHDLSEERRLKLESQNQQLSDYEAEVGLLRRRVEGLEGDKERDKKTIATLTLTLNSTRQNLDDETLRHIDAENRRQTLEEEMEFLRTVHEQELKELAALAYRDTTAENRDFWKNEMGSALREIQDMYDDKMEMIRSEIETSYSHKLQEVKTGATRQNMESSHTKEETKRLRTQMTDFREKLSDLEGKNMQLTRELESVKRSKDEMEREYENENSELKVSIAHLRAEIETILQELQHIMDTKLGLELEIAAYRKLLEGEESRVGLRQFVDSYSGAGGGGMGGGSGGGMGGGMGGGSGGGGGGFSYSSSSGGGGGGGMGLMKGEIQAKTTYQKTAKGPAAITEVSKDGKFIMIENSGRKTESLGSWKLNRFVDDKETVNFNLPSDFKIAAGDKVKIWVRNQKPENAGASDLELSVESLGNGGINTTKLVNTAGEDRATYVEKTTYG